MGLMALAAAASTSLIKDQLLARNTQRFLDETELVAQEVRELLTTPAACLATFTGVDLIPGTDYVITNIRAPDASAQFSTGNVYHDRATRLVGMSLSAYQEEKPPLGRALLILQFESVAQVTGTNRVNRSIQIATQRNAGTQLIGCGSRLNQEEGIWQNSESNSTLETVSQVGIGTSDPQAALDVKNGFIHAQLDCRVVDGPGTAGSYNEISCAADEWVINGGGICTSPEVDNVNGGFLWTSQPNADLTSWMVACYRADQSATTLDLTVGNAYAICCKK